MKNIIIIIIIAVINLSAQDFIYERSIGEFNTAVSFSISPGGYIYVSDIGTDEIYKLDTLGNVLKERGGHGWDIAQFDDPVNIYATTLRIYVSDYNNHRIQMFDKDLNYISQLTTYNSSNIDEVFGYPLSAITSKMEDLFVLDSENKKIVKFDIFGRFSIKFAGFEAGEYSLNDPKQMAFVAGNKIAVLDGSSIKYYDYFGNNIAIMNYKMNPVSINSTYENVLLTSKDNVFISSVEENSMWFNPILLEGEYPQDNFCSALIFNDRLYILTNTQILIFRK